MLEELFKKTDAFRNKVTEYMETKEIEKREKELGVNFPDPMREFYQHFGKDKDFLSAYYIFDSLENVEIENNALCFGYKHQRSARLGIEISDLETKSQRVSFYLSERGKWYVEIGAAVIFFYQTAVWQIMNTMPSIARVPMSQKDFGLFANKEMKYLSNDKLLMLGDKIPIMGDEILGCYFRRDELLYLSAKEDEILETKEEIFNIDLDWL